MAAEEFTIPLLVENEQVGRLQGNYSVQEVTADRLQDNTDELISVKKSDLQAIVDNLVKLSIGIFLQLNLH